MKNQSEKIVLSIADSNEPKSNVNHASILRSAATFYYRGSAKKRTLVSIFDYWTIKNSLNVKIIASLRSMKGNLLKREELNFKNGNVLNYEPMAAKEFEGSVEIEIFSAEDLRFPYPAIIVHYISENSITFTHTYGRTYSQHEIEDQRTTISSDTIDRFQLPLLLKSFGHESGWTVKDTNEIKSFCIFHNGSHQIKEQDMSLTLKRLNDNEEKRVQFKLHALEPFETVKIYPREIFKEMVDFLNGEIGHISVNFQLFGAFPRMLIGNESLDGTKLQVTHSNFNYSKIQTELVKSEDPYAIFMPPKIDCKVYNVVIYPDFAPGNYQVEINNIKTKKFSPGEIIKIPVAGGEVLRFKRKEVGFPSRMSLGLEFGKNEDSFISECSLGVTTNNQSEYTKAKLLKRFHWGSCLVSQQFKSKLLFTDSCDIFGDIKEEAEIIIRFYAINRKDYIERKFLGKDYHNLSQHGFNFNDDTEIYSFMAGEIGWWTVFSNYKGLNPYILVYDERNSSLVLEHAF